MNEIIIELIRETAENMDISCTSYSGRGMYGTSCLSIRGKLGELQSVIAEVIKHVAQNVYDHAIEAETEADEELASKYNDDLAEIIDRIMQYSQDSLGLGVVFYWPNIKH